MTKFKLAKKVKHFSNFIKEHHKLLLISVLSLGFIILGSIAFWISTFEIPDLKSFGSRTVTQSTKIYDRTGKILLFDTNQNIKREVVSYDKISPYIKKATVAIEDADFFKHHGIKITSIIRAVLSNLTGGSTQGGSTITQQVIKNSLLTSEKAVSRKLKEWVLALRLERVLTKDEILSTYLNESPYGGSIYGVEEASQTFFGKKSADVTLAEAAYLAAIPNAPTYFSPYGKNKDKLDGRKNLVLQKMLENDLISQAEFDAASKEKVVFKVKSNTSLKAPHFVEFVNQYLVEKYGERTIREDGLKVTTTLDYGFQVKAEEIVKKSALENEARVGAKNAALVAIDPKTGQILTMVGSRDYFDKEIEGNFNVTLAYRQPGSTFKPFVYVTAFAKGYTPDTVLFDLPTQFQTTCTADGRPIGNTNPDDCYMPRNYDGKFVGPITLRNVLAQSRNIPSIKTLYLAGIKDSITTARNMGIKSLGDANQYGLTLVLGGGEVSLLDMTSAYGVFATAGVRNPYTPILKVENTKGEILEEFSSKPEIVLNENNANQISDILSDNVARAPIFGANSQMYFKDRQVAVKTGTTNDFRDAWIIGYTPNLVVGAWGGNNDNSPMSQNSAGFIISPMWRAFMNEVLPSLPKEYFTSPEPTPKEIKPVFRGVWQGYKSFTIDKISGKLATEFTPTETQEEVFTPDVHEILYWVDKNDPWGAIPEKPEEDPQFKLWEYSVQKWAATQYLPIPKKPSSYDDIHTKEKGPNITIIDPNSSVQYKPDQKITIQTTNRGSYPLMKLDFYVNNTYIGSSETSPFLLSFIPSEINTIGKTNKLKVIATDLVFNRSESEIEFSVDQ